MEGSIEEWYGPFSRSRCPIRPQSSEDICAYVLTYVAIDVKGPRHTFTGEIAGLSHFGQWDAEGPCPAARFRVCYAPPRRPKGTPKVTAAQI